MNIEKFKNYNQVMLAALSTLLVIMALIGLVAIVFVFVEANTPYGPTQDDFLLSDTKVDELTQQNLRKQIISYDAPDLIDSANLVYLIKVKVKTLKKPESVAKESYLMYDEYESSSLRRYRGKSFYGTFNNLLVYDYLTNNTKRMIDSRLIANGLFVQYFEDDIIGVFKGAEKDTNKDGDITLSDHNSLYIFSLKEKIPRKITVDNATVISFVFVDGQKDILITFGLDRNNNGQYDSELEPSFVMHFDYATGELRKILNEQGEQELQKIIDKI